MDISTSKTHSMVLNNKDQDILVLKARNDALSSQLASLQSELRQREVSVYELVQRSHDLSERLNNKTTENGRLNKKLVTLAASHSELKSRFIESLKKLKACRELFRLSIEVLGRFGASLTDVLQRLASGSEFDFEKPSSLIRRIRNNDLRFALGTHDFPEINGLLERVEQVNTSRTKELYDNLLHALQAGHIFEFHSEEDRDKGSQSVHLITQPRLDTSSLNVSLMNPTPTHQIDRSITSSSHFKALTSPPTRAKVMNKPSKKGQVGGEELLGICESDDNSFEQTLTETKLKPVAQTSAPPDSELFKSAELPLGEPSPVPTGRTDRTHAKRFAFAPNDLGLTKSQSMKIEPTYSFKHNLRAPKLQFNFVNQDSQLGHSFLYQHLF